MTHDASSFALCAWRERLDAFVLARRFTPFAWGTNDCCLFAADAVLAMTGVDHAADVRGTYSDAREAVQVLAGLGGLAAVASRGGPECPPLCARVGDVGIVNDGERDALAVCLGEVWAVPVTGGLAVMLFESAQRAWRIHG